MSREKEIDKASNSYSYGFYSGDNVSPYCCFRDGAKWSDAHPVSPWVSVKESLPKEDPERNDYMSVEVLTMTDKGYFNLDVYDYQNQRWFILSEVLGVDENDDSLGEVAHWMYIPKLPVNENV